MNSLQTDTVAGIVKRMGYTEVSREEDADVVIYNTCTVRENANLKIYGHLGHLKSIKKKNPELKIVLFGCMMQEPEVIEKITKNILLLIWFSVPITSISFRSFSTEA